MENKFIKIVMMVFVVFFVVLFFNSCLFYEKDYILSGNDISHLKPMRIFPNDLLNEVKVIDPNGNIFYSDGSYIFIEDPINGTYNIEITLNKLQNEIVPGSTELGNVAIRINGSAENSVSIDEFNVPVLWDYETYSFIVVARDGKNTYQQK